MMAIIIFFKRGFISYNLSLNATLGQLRSIQKVLYTGVIMNDNTQNPYEEEARARWGNTKAFKQSEIRVKKMGEEGLKKAMEENGKITEEMAECMKSGEKSESERAQKLIARHYEWLRNFYDPTPEMYRGLAEMYMTDERFKANYEKVAEGLAEYMKEAMMEYATNLQG